MSQSPKPLAEAALSESEWIADLALRFDREWTPQRLADLVTEFNNRPDEGRRQALIVLVKIDLERRWLSDQSQGIEHYLKQFPDLGITETVAPELLLAEWDVRKQHGDPPRFGDFARRFPQQASALHKLIQQAEQNQSAARGEAKASVSHRETPHPSRASTASIARERLSASAPTTPSARDTDQELSGMFGKYEIRRQLGKGGMGEVYLAYDPKADREVALKIPQFKEQKTAEVIERFYREVRLAATLQHANICPIWEVGEVYGMPYLVMPLIKGETLADRLAKRSSPIDQSKAAQLIRKLALALAEAHRQNIIHRDLKPANIMFDHRKEPIVMDFGLARRAGDSERRISQSGMIIGTPAYMPIEQVEGRDDRVGPHSDVYSLGIILYELLTGRVPFEGPVISVLGQVLKVQPATPTTHRSDLDPRLEAVCLKAIAKQPVDRYPTMTEFAAALQEFLKSPRDGDTPASQPFPMFTDDEPASDVADHGRSPATQTTVLVQAQKLHAHWKRFPLIARSIGSLGFATLLLGVILFFRNGDALVKVELLVDDVEVTLRDKTISLKDAAGAKDGSIAREVKVTPGETTLKVRTADGEFETNKFTLTRGDNPAVVVELIDNELTTSFGDEVISRRTLATFKKGLPKPTIATGLVSAANTIRPIIHSRTIPAGYCFDVAFTADERQFVSIDLTNELTLWDATSGEKVRILGKNAERADNLRIVGGGRLVSASGFNSGKTALFDLGKTGEPLGTLPGGNAYGRPAISQDGSRLVVSSGTTARVFRISVIPPSGSRDKLIPKELANQKPLIDVTASCGQVVVHLEAQLPSFGDVAISPTNPNWLYFQPEKNVNTVSLWDLSTNQATASLAGLDWWPMVLRVSADGRLAFAHSKAPKHNVWNATTGEVLATFDGPSFEAAMDLSPDGRRALIHASDAHLEEWQLNPPKRLRELRPPQHRIHHAYYLGNGSRAVVASSNGAEFFELPPVELDAIAPTSGSSSEQTPGKSSPTTLTPIVSNVPQWSTEDIQAGRIKAPDLSKLTPVWDDDFSTTKKSGISRGNSGVVVSAKEGAVHFDVKNGDWFWVDGLNRVPRLDEFACRVVAKSKSTGKGFQGWRFLLTTGGFKGIEFVLRRDAKLILNPYKGSDPRRFPDISHPAIKPETENNELLVISRKGRLEIYVNGVAVCSPVDWPFDLSQAKIDIGLRGIAGAHAEFDSFTMWPAQDIPTLEERIAKKELPPPINGVSVSQTSSPASVVESPSVSSPTLADPFQAGTNWVAKDSRGNVASEFKILKRNGNDLEIHYRGTSNVIDAKAKLVDSGIQWSHKDVSKVEKGKAFKGTVTPVAGQPQCRLDWEVDSKNRNQVVLTLERTPKELESPTAGAGIGDSSEDDSEGETATPPKPVPVEAGESLAAVQFNKADLAAGKIKAPSLAGIKPISDDDLSSEKKNGMPVINTKGRAKSFFQDGTYRIEAGGTWAYRTMDRPPTMSDFAVLLRMRVEGKADTASCIIARRGEEFGLMLNVFGDGRLQLVPRANSDSRPRVEVLHPAIKPAGEFNDVLLVIRKNRRVETYVNSIAVCQPIDWEQELLGLQFRPGFSGPRGKVKVAYDHITAWPAADIPSLEARAAKGEFSLAPRVAPVTQNTRSKP